MKLQFGTALAMAVGLMSANQCAKAAKLRLKGG
jgi:hypothetical protein